MSRKCREISRPPRSCEQDFDFVFTRFPFPPPLIYDASHQKKWRAWSHEDHSAALPPWLPHKSRAVTSLLRTSAISGRHESGSSYHTTASLLFVSPIDLAVVQVDKLRGIGSKNAVTCHSKCRQNFNFIAMPSPLDVLPDFSLSLSS